MFNTGHRHQPVVGGRHDQHTDLDRVYVLGYGHRRLQPQGGGLNLLGAHDLGLGDSCAEHGTDETQAPIGDSPL